MTRRAILTLSKKTYKRQGQANMKKMSMRRNMLQQLKIVTPEDKHPKVDHPCPGTKTSFLVYVMPVIAIVIKL